MTNEKFKDIQEFPLRRNQDLPDGWKWARLEDIAGVFSGSSAPQGNDFFCESGMPFVRVSDLSNCNAAGVIEETRDHLSEKAISSCPLVKAPKDSVVFPKSGAAIATNRRAVLGMDAYIVGHLLALVVKPEEIMMEWLYSAMRRIDMMEYSDNSGYPSLKKSIVEGIEIPLPPLAEQKRIVAILNEQMRAVEKARVAGLERVEAIRTLSLAWLREVFSFDDGELPQGWRWVKLGSICKTSAGGTPSRNVESFYGGDIPWVKSGELNNRFVSETRETITQLGIDKSSAKIFPKGTLLIALYGATVGELGILDIDAATNQAVCAIFPSDSIKRDYLFFFLLYTKKHLVEASFGGAQPNISQSVVRSLNIPLPPLREQKRLVSALNAQMTTAKKALTAAEAELDAITALPSALLRKAFSGAL